MMVVFITFMVLSVVIIGWCVWMDEQIDNDVEFPESELEKSVRNIKFRIAEAEWKFKREIGEQ